MPKFLRENPTLMFGLLFPLFVVVVLLVATWVQRIGIEPPRYPVLFASNYSDNSYANYFTAKIENQHFRLVYHATANNNYTSRPMLYLYDPVTNTTREINFANPDIITQCTNVSSEECKNHKVPATVDVPVPELDKLYFDDNAVSPDGYAFIVRSGGSGDIFTELFFNRHRYQNMPGLQKGSYRMTIPQDSRYFYNLHFIAWVIPNGK